MRINEIIRERRIAKNFTQEQMAGYLGVTAPAVNKWEKGTSYPDITILPALARVLDTDLNTLLSFQDDLSEKEIALFLNYLSETAEKEGVAQAFQTAFDKIREFPTCYPLILNTALTLDGLTIMQGKMKEYEKYQRDVEDLYLRALESSDSAIENHAKAMLISKHMQRKEYEQAQELLETLPEQDLFDKKQIQINLLLETGKTEEAAQIAEGKLLSATTEIYAVLLSLMEIAIKENRMEDAEYIANVHKKAAENFDLWEYNSYVAHAQLYDATKQRRKMLKLLVPMLRSLTHKWELSKSPLYRHIKEKEPEKNIGVKMQKVILESLKDGDEEGHFLEDEEIEKIMTEVENKKNF